MHYLKLISFSIITLGITQFSCSKYDEGKASIRTKENRLCQQWQVYKGIVVTNIETGQSHDITNRDWKNATMTFTKEGVYKKTQYIANLDNPSDPEPYVEVHANGSWEFFNEKRQLFVSYHETGKILENNLVVEDYQVDKEIWRISKLQKDELWVTYYTKGNPNQRTDLFLRRLNE